jgi:hypothetical protein
MLGQQDLRAQGEDGHDGRDHQEEGRRVKAKPMATLRTTTPASQRL